tara:strand:- start:2871 stop:2987 length:117 start_codon:yes stop_codon:yes gene_type:complete
MKQAFAIAKSVLSYDEKFVSKLNFKKKSTQIVVISRLF